MNDERYQDDEINIIEYVKVIVKRKKIILSIFIVCVAAAAIVSFLMPRMFLVSDLTRTQSALRDSGLRCVTASRYVKSTLVSTAEASG